MDDELDDIERLCSLGLILYVHTEQQQGWHITAKGIAFYRESTDT
jgi:predicted transcriptional regulator